MRLGFLVVWDSLFKFAFPDFRFAQRSNPTAFESFVKRVEYDLLLLFVCLGWPPHYGVRKDVLIEIDD